MASRPPDEPTEVAVENALIATFTAARMGPPTKHEISLYRQALAGVPDRVLAAAVLRLARVETWEFGRRPSPAMILEYVAIVRARSAARAQRPPDPPNLTAPGDAARARMDALRAEVTEAWRSQRG